MTPAAQLCPGCAGALLGRWRACRPAATDVPGPALTLPPQTLRTTPGAPRRESCEAARQRVKQLLRGLSAQLDHGQLLAALTNASAASVIVTALGHHAEEVLRRRQWCLPTLLPPPAPAAAAPAGAGAPGSSAGSAGSDGLLPPLEVSGMWPYWLDGSDPATARNSYSLGGMVLLTGPNMAGKSTLLRWGGPGHTLGCTEPGALVGLSAC